MNENKKEKLVVDDIEVIVRGIAHKPYFEIKYREVGKHYYNIGFGSYDLDNVLKWKEEEFEVVSEEEEKEEEEETKEVTNEELLEHLKQVESAEFLIVNGLSMIFELMVDRKEELKLTKEECITMRSGIMAYNICSDSIQKSLGLMKTIDVDNTISKMLEDIFTFLK